MVFFPMGATSLLKVAECILLLLIMLIVLLWGGPRLRRQAIRLLLKHLKLEQLSKWIPSGRNEKHERMSLIVERLSFKKLLLLIEEQTSYTFFYEEEIFKQAKPVTIHRKDATVEEILDEALEFQPKSFSYSINGKIIFLKRTPKKWRRE
jgi:hypothetical protein